MSAAAKPTRRRTLKNHIGDPRIDMTLSRIASFATSTTCDSRLCVSKVAVSDDVREAMREVCNARAGARRASF